ncbi:MAG: DUF4440 domain-containing protein [Candidatus Tectomicrobia bacterium]|nr:DUF4440 domain-containing protein [Candidatus Tectomicrobia bacterium]
MPARKPEECDLLIAEAITQGELDAAVALYEPGATFVPEPGKAATGKEAVRQALSGFIALKPTLTLEVPKVIQAGEIALLCSEWSLTGTGPDGRPVNLSGRGTEVVRRQPDGTWKFIIDNPFGVD